MFRRNTNSGGQGGPGRQSRPAEQGERRRVQRGTGPAAFSYYTSRVSDGPPGAPARPDRTGRLNAGVNERTAGLGDRSDRAERAADGRPARPRRLAAALPFWLLLAVALVCAGKVLWLSSSPKVVVLDNTPVTATYMRSTDVYAAAAQRLLNGSLLNHTKLTADLNGTARALERAFPELQTVSLGVPLVSNRPVVYVQPARPDLVLRTPHGNYAVQQSGLVLARLSRLPAGIPTLVDQSGTTPKPGKQYLPGSTVSFVQTMAYQLAQAKLPVSTFVLPPQSPYELDVRLTGRAYVVRCNLEADALTQSGAAIAAIRHLGNSAPASYLDVRVPGRVYYR